MHVKPREPFLPALSSLLSAPAHDVEITVPRGAVLSGTIRSADRTPLENVNVSACLTTGRSNENPIGVAEITDPDRGAFRITGLPAQTVLLSASAGDCLPADPIVFDLHEGDRREGIEIVLESGQTINGKVIDQSTGNGVPKAWISLSHWAGSHSAITDEAGEFRLRGVPAGDVALTVQHPDFAPAKPNLTVRADRPTFITIPLGRGATLTGTVKTAGGSAVPLMRIEVGREGGIPVWTSSDGTFSFEHLPAGENYVSCVGGSDRYEDTETRRVQLIEGHTARVDFVIGPRVEGRVTRGGLPVAGARIALTLVPPPGPGGVHGEEFVARAGWTDPAGQFRLDGVGVGENAVVVFADGQRTQRKVVIPDESVFTCDIALPSRSIPGQIISRRTQGPVGGVTVQGTPRRPGGDGGWMNSTWNGRADGETEVLYQGNLEIDDGVVSAPDGSFTFWAEEGIRYLLSARSDADGEGTVAVPERGNGPVLLALRRPAHLSVKVTTPDGLVVKKYSACLSLNTKQGDSQTCRIQSSGEFSFEAEEGSTGVVEAAAPHSVPRSMPIGPLRSDDSSEPNQLEIQLEPAGSIWVRFPAGAALELKRLRHQDGTEISEKIAGGSRFQKGKDPTSPTLTIEDLAPGTYILEFSGPKTTTVTAEVKADEVTEVRVE